MRSPQPSTVLSVVAVVLALGGGAIAAIPNADGTISACYVNGSGELRVSATGACEADETRITLDRKQPIPNGSIGPEKLKKVPAARAFQNADQPIGKKSSAVLSLGEEEFDTANIHAAGPAYPANGYMTVPRTGIYQIDAGTNFLISHKQGHVYLKVRRGDGSTEILEQEVASQNGNTPGPTRFSTLRLLRSGWQVYLEAENDANRMYAVLWSSLSLNYVSDE